jgi:hypothetical protein
VRGYRTLVLALLALGAALAAPGAAHAEDYAPPAVEAPAVVTAGAAIPFSGSGFMPGSNVDINVEYTGSNSTASNRGAAKGGIVLAGLAVPDLFIKTVVADALGNFATTITLPHSGVAKILGSGIDMNGDPLTVSVTVTVAPSAAELAAARAAMLPVTGNSGDRLGMEVAAGSGAVLLGGAVIWLTVIWRRRRVHEV